MNLCYFGVIGILEMKRVCLVLLSCRKLELTKGENYNLNDMDIFFFVLCVVLSIVIVLLSFFADPRQ